LAGVMAVITLLSCVRARTELKVVVDTDIEYGAMKPLRSVVITVRSNDYDGAIEWQQSYPVEPAPTDGSTGKIRLPEWFGVVPRDDDSQRRVWVEVLGCSTRANCLADRT